VLSVKRQDGIERVTVVPNTHGAPANPELTIEIPREVKRHLGLDAKRSWIVACEASTFK